MSASIPVNWQGMKIVSATNVAAIDSKITSQPATVFPNGTACPAGTTIDRYGRFRVNSAGVNMAADGEAFSGLNALPSPVQSCLLNEQGKTPLERDNTAKEYTLFIRDYIPGTGPDDVIAQEWATRAAAVNNNGWSGAGITINHVKSDAAQINQAKYNTTMHQF